MNDRLAKIQQQQHKTTTNQEKDVQKYNNNTKQQQQQHKTTTNQEKDVQKYNNNNNNNNNNTKQPPIRKKTKHQKVKTKNKTQVKQGKVFV